MFKEKNHFFLNKWAYFSSALLAGDNQSKVTLYFCHTQAMLKAWTVMLEKSGYFQHIVDILGAFS